ncbi:MAG TPA: sodium:proton antiporter [Anaerolineales bacterium]|nr:sodium:proton antiporter [Anaerolineales bacterium]
METSLVVFFALVVAYTVYSLWLGRFSVTMPMIFVVVGAVIGAHGLGLFEYGLTSSSLETLTEVTLALLLFADAVTLDFNKVKADAQLPTRLLVIGLPLTILLGGLAAYTFFPLEGIGFALLLGTILAPTDAALGLPIFNNPRVPVRIRRALNVESGLNDGIASPLVVLFIALELEQLTSTGGNWVLSALSEITIGVVAGILFGLAGGFLYRWAVERNLTSHTARQIGNPALALLVYFAAGALHGNGFVAVFMAGLLFGYTSRHLLHEATEYTEISGTLLSLFVWSLFGAALVIPLLLQFNLQAFLFALLSLTVVRMLPVAIALIRTGVRPDTKLMMGWLGPRGLASVVFMLMAYEATHAAGLPTENLLAAAGWTILLSVFLHGLSALPLANWYARRLETADPQSPELLELPEIPAKRKTMAGFHLPHRQAHSPEEMKN